MKKGISAYHNATLNADLAAKKIGCRPGNLLRCFNGITVRSWQVLEAGTMVFNTTTERCVVDAFQHNHGLVLCNNVKVNLLEELDSSVEVGCNLCDLVCPVPGCITMEQQDTDQPYMNWTRHPNNPMRTD